MCRNSGKGLKSLKNKAIIGPKSITKRNLLSMCLGHTQQRVRQRVSSKAGKNILTLVF